VWSLLCGKSLPIVQGCTSGRLWSLVRPSLCLLGPPIVNAFLRRSVAITAKLKAAPIDIHRQLSTEVIPSPTVPCLNAQFVCADRACWMTWAVVIEGRHFDLLDWKDFLQPRSIPLSRLLICQTAPEESRRRIIRKTRGRSRATMRHRFRH
jgi:hypothetical protein